EKVHREHEEERHGPETTEIEPLRTIAFLGMVGGRRFTSGGIRNGSQLFPHRTSTPVFWASHNIPVCRVSSTDDASPFGVPFAFLFSNYRARCIRQSKNYRQADCKIC